MVFIFLFTKSLKTKALKRKLQNEYNCKIHVHEFRPRSIRPRAEVVGRGGAPRWCAEVVARGGGPRAEGRDFGPGKSNVVQEGLFYCIFACTGVQQMCARSRSFSNLPSFPEWVGGTKHFSKITKREGTHFSTAKLPPQEYKTHLTIIMAGYAG